MSIFDHLCFDNGFDDVGCDIPVVGRELIVNHQEACDAHNGMVIVIEDGHKYDGVELIRKRYPWVNSTWLYENRRFFCPDKIVTRATCHNDDVYDEKVGLNLAIVKLNKIAKSQREGAVKAFESYIRNQMANPAAKRK